MFFELELSENADESLNRLQKFNLKKYKKVAKALRQMQTDLRHPSLNTHKYSGYPSPEGVEVFESYAENKTPGAYRLFWHYGPGKGVLTILAITPHP
ncbi:MAG: hypothetical protein WA902_15555 [Thermosynechococcaceae cyanobacterium]